MKCYQVGGSVRDEILGVEPKDYDYCVVGSTPEEMLEKGFTKVTCKGNVSEYECPQSYIYEVKVNSKRLHQTSVDL